MAVHVLPLVDSDWSIDDQSLPRVRWQPALHDDDDDGHPHFDTSDNERTDDELKETIARTSDCSDTNMCICCCINLCSTLSTAMGSTGNTR